MDTMAVQVKGFGMRECAVVEVHKRVLLTLEIIFVGT